MAFGNLGAMIGAPYRVPSAAGMQQQQNPLDSMSKIVDIQNAMNQNRLFQRQQAGLDRFGQIVAGANSPEEGLALAMQDPMAVEFAGPAFANLRESQLALTQMHEVQLRMTGEQYNQSSSALQAVFRGMAPLMNQPGFTSADFDGFVGAQMARNSPQMRADAQPYINSAKTFMFNGLEGMTPEQRTQTLRARLGGLMLGVNVSPDDVRALTGMVAPGVGQGPFGVGGAPITFPVGGPAAGWPASAQPGAPGAPGAAVPASGSPKPTDTGAPAGGAPTGGAPGVPAGPVQTAATGQLAAPTQMSATGVPSLQGLTKEEEETAKGFGQSSVDVKNEMIATANTAPMLANKMNVTQEQLGKFLAGAGADSRADMAQAVQAIAGEFGVPQETINGWKDTLMQQGKVAAQQVFKALIGQYAVASLKDVTGGTKQFRPEVDSFINAMGTTTDPRALMELINRVGRPIIQKQYDMMDKWGTYTNNGTNLSGMSNFPVWYATHMPKPEDLPKTAPNGMNIGPVPVPAAMGVTPTKEEQRKNWGGFPTQ